MGGTARGVLLAALVMGAPAAQAKTHEWSWMVRATPITVTIDFHGDAAAGCADHGLCDTSGTVTYRSPKGYGILNGSIKGKHFSAYGLTFNLKTLARVSVSVTTTGAAAPCTDEGAGLLTLFGVDDQRDFVFGSIPKGSFPGFGASQPFADFLASRCAGPTGFDVAGGLVAQRLPKGFLSRRTIIVDLNHSAPFSGGGFVGTVTTTGQMTLRK